MEDNLISFRGTNAASYDSRNAHMAPLRDGLNFCQLMVLSSLPDNARILVVGAGTGVELLYMALARPGWSFLAVEPVPEMLTICRRRAKENGLASRCDFHEGYLDTLAAGRPFDGATAILVSQFLRSLEARTEFFRQIAMRLQPGGILVSSDLASESLSGEAFGDLFAKWCRMLLSREAKPEEAAQILDAWTKGISLLPPKEIESLIRSAGFSPPIAFFQALFIRGWYATKG